MLFRLRGTCQALRRIRQSGQALRRNRFLAGVTDPVGALCHPGERRADSCYLLAVTRCKLVEDGVILSC